MYGQIKTKFRTYLGVFLIIFGILGIILPILPGWWIILIGMEILGWKLVIDRNKPWKNVINIVNKKDFVSNEKIKKVSLKNSKNDKGVIR